MNNLLNLIGLALALTFAAGCGEPQPHGHDGHNDHGEAAAPEVVKGPHNGRMLVDGDFALELAIFETGVPPEFRVWATKAGKPLAPKTVALSVTLTRLGDVKDEIAFKPQEDFLRGNREIYEPHSFVVTIEARHGGKSHRWQYDNFEGRTRIGAEVASAFGLETEIAAPATLRETVPVYGRVVPNGDNSRQISARFEGTLQTVSVSPGDRVAKGQVLASVESNESLTRYNIVAPIDGIVSARNAQPGEQTAGRTLFRLMDNSSVWVELAVFPRDLPQVKVGAAVSITGLNGEKARQGEISYLASTANPDQSVIARVALPNPEGALVPGMFVSGAIEVAEHKVGLAVKRTGLQSFRDFTVVYAQIGDDYEVRMLELGRQDGEWIEVLGGLAPGTRYVTTNSYLIKADIEKSGASHDH